MEVVEIAAKSLTRRSRRVDSWFLSWCGMNLYRGCEHNCAYCDGRAERYQVEGDFGRTVAAKTNAAALLDRELDPSRWRRPRPGGFVLLGGGVGDSYQPAEATYRLSRRALEILHARRFPVHLLTKSTLVERDLDLVTEIAEESGSLVSFSLSTTDDPTAGYFEPLASPPSERLACLSRLRSRGLHGGIYLMPILPFVTDSARAIEESVRRSVDAGAEFIVFGELTLKRGRQWDHYFGRLADGYPDIAARYTELYPGDRWGAPIPEYEATIAWRMYETATRYAVPLRMPPRLFRHLVSKLELAAIMLEHLDYFQHLRGNGSHFARAARSLAELTDDRLPEDLKTLPGVGPFTERLIREILAGGRCPYYDRLAGS